MNRLKQARADREWTATQLAHELEKAGARIGYVLNSRDSLKRQIRSWEAGQQPREPVPELFCAVYGRTRDELGLLPAGGGMLSDLGLVYSRSVAEAAATLSELARHDVDSHTAVVNGAFSEHALYAACLDWLFAQPDILDPSQATAKVTSRDVDELRASTAMFDTMDRQFGGAQSRRLAAQYLRETVGPRLRSQYTDKVGRDLYNATSVLCELVGWMAYDAGLHSLAQRYFIQALRLASAAGDRAYGVYVLTTMGHQAVFLKRPDQALRLAQAAGDNSGRLNLPRLEAEAAMLTAQAQAQLGDARGCADALRRAEQTFERSGTAVAPPWLGHWTDAVFGAYAGSCLLNLGKVRDATPYLEMAWENAKGQRRREVYAASQLAIAALLDKDLDRAAILGIRAVESAREVTSVRSLKEVEELQKRLAPHHKHPRVQEFDERARLVLAS